MMKQSLRYTVIGAGNGGKAMAGHLALMGFETTLYNRTYENIASIKTHGGISIESEDPNGPTGFGVLKCVTSDLEQAIENSDIIMVVVPSTAHIEIAYRAAPYLRSGQIIILNPGRTFGAIEFSQTLNSQGCQEGVIVAESQTFIYASRSEGPAKARIFRVKEAVPLSALPATQTSLVLKALSNAYPQFFDGGNVLHTGINNIGAIFHPTISIFNAGWIEARRGDFQFYLEGVTPTVARMMEVLDRERVTVASAIGVRAVTACEWLKMAYNAVGGTLYESIHNQSGYRGIKAPITLNHRYITEDVPMSLVPIASLGNRFGVSVRGMESLIHLACIAHRTDYWHCGRTLERLGIEHLSVSELTRYANSASNFPMPAYAIRPKLIQLPVAGFENSRNIGGDDLRSRRPLPTDVTRFSKTPTPRN